MTQIQKNKKNIMSISILVIVMVLMITVQMSYGATLTVNASDSANYTKIQDAINNSSSGDTILVHSGTYYENVNVSKQIVLKGIDNGSGKPVVDAGGIGSAIRVNAVNSTIEGFTVTNADIEPNGNFMPVVGGILVTSNNNTLNSNNASNNKHFGIMIYMSSNNTLNGNMAFHNDDGGIYVWYSHNNTLSNNVNLYGAHGIYLDDSSNNNILSNNIVINSIIEGVFIGNSYNNTLSNNTVSNSRFGIQIASSSNNTLSNNTVSNYSVRGVDISKSNNNVLIGNTLSNNAVSNSSVRGLYLYSSSNNTLIYNNVSNNRGGIWPERYSMYNIIYHNNLVNNTQNANTMDDNIWDNGYPSGGNYWDDYKGVDNFSGVYQNQTGSDGIGDTPYNISNSGEQDMYPFIKMNGWIQDEIQLQIIRGDVNRNGKLDTGDATIILKSITGKSIPDEYLPLLPTGDMNCNNKLDTGDVTMILRSIVGIPIKKCW